MFCPLCGAHTEVTEKRGPYRDRRCTNAGCGQDFTTRENILPVRKGRLCAKTRALRGGGLPPPPVTGDERDAIAGPCLDAPPGPGEVERSRLAHKRRLHDAREIESEEGREGVALRAS